MVKQQTKVKPQLEKIELTNVFGELDGPKPAEPGAPLPYRSWQVDPYQRRDVPPALATVCRLLCRRGWHGTHVSEIGGVGTLAELECYGIGVEVVAMPKRGTGATKCWVKPRVVFRFAENPSGERHHFPEIT